MALMTVKRVGVLSFAKIQSLIMAFFGMVLGVIYGLIFMIFGAAILSQGGNSGIGAGISGVVIGLVFMVAVPIFYGVIGFIFGALAALIYNLAASSIGGIELELETAAPDYSALPPPPPQQWDASSFQQQQQQQPRY